MDCTNIDGANGNEAPGFLNEPNLRDECLNCAAIIGMESGEVHEPEVYGFLGTINVLRKRGLLTLQALELLQRDGDLTPLER